MILWFSQHFGHPQSIQEFKSYLDRIDIARLTNIYLCYWEEAEVNLKHILQTEDAYDQIADLLNQINQEYNKNIEFRIILGCTSDSAPTWFDRTDTKYKYIKEVYLPASLFFRTQYRLGPENDPQKPFNLEQAEVYNKILDTTNLDMIDMHTGLSFTEFKYDYIYMTLHPKPHRCLMMDMLAKYDLHQHGALSWREFDKTVPRDQVPDNILDSEFSKYPWQYWTPKRLFLDQVTDKAEPCDFDILPKEYSESFMQLVGESIFTGPNLISEKTVVPLLFNKPFLSLSSKHFHRSIEDLGFKLYDEIFDYTFDELDNVEDRVEGIISNIKNIQILKKQIGFKGMIDLIKDKLVHNKKLSHRITVDENALPYEFRELLEHNDYAKHDSCYFIDPKSIFPYADYAIKFNNKYMHE